MHDGYRLIVSSLQPEIGASTRSGPYTRLRAAVPPGHSRRLQLIKASHENAMPDSPAADSFLGRLDSAQKRSGSCLCVGLDPDLERMPTVPGAPASATERITEFCTAIVAATSQHACAFKLNLAFFERHGEAGWRALRDTLSVIPRDIPTIADAKRGDIGNTAKQYAESLFEHFGFDACTVSPYMGSESVEPFARYAGRGVFVLCRTSNPSADEFQLVGDNKPLYVAVAEHAVAWDRRYPAAVGLVVGATQPDDLKRLRAMAPDLPFLIPGVGAQGGDPQRAVRLAQTRKGRVLVNSSRSILYASSGADFAAAAGEQAIRLKKALAVNPVMA